MLGRLGRLASFAAASWRLAAALAAAGVAGQGAASPLGPAAGPLPAAAVVVFDPPEPLPCGLPGWTLRLATGADVRLVRFDYLPSSLGVVAVPVLAGRVFCDGFESAE